MLKTTEKRKMRLEFAFFCEVPLQISLRHSKYLRVLGSSWSFNRFLSFVEICTIYSFLFAIVVEPRLSPILFHGILVFLSTAWIADFPRYHVDLPDCYICLVVQQAPRERYQAVRCGRDIVQTHRSNQWFYGIFYIENRFPIDPKYSQRFCLSSL